MSQSSKLMAYLEENPRMIGVAFTMALLLSQVGNVSAAAMSTCGGP